MAQDSRRSAAARTSTQVRDSSLGDAWTVLSHLISGFVVFGAIGWGLAHVTGSRWFLVTGLLLGAAASGALIYYRYVYVPPKGDLPTGEATGSKDRKEQHG